VTRYIIIDDFCHRKKAEYIYLHIALCVCHSLNSAPPKLHSWLRPCVYRAVLYLSLSFSLAQSVDEIKLAYLIMLTHTVIVHVIFPFMHALVREHRDIPTRQRHTWSRFMTS
jgi:hypothetical protein